MAGDGPDIELPDPRAILEQELAGVLSGGLGEVLVAEGISREEITLRAGAESDQILAGAEPAWEQLVGALGLRAELEETIGPPLEGLRLGRLVLTPSYLATAVLGGVVAAALAATLLFSGSILLPVIIGAAVTTLSAYLTPPTVRVLRAGMQEGYLESVRETTQAEEVRYRATLRGAGIEPWIREQLNAHRERSYSTVLSYADASGLAEIDDPRREIPTEARRRLERLISRMPGGAIGISGPRGVGKTTLVRSLCRGEGGDGARRILATVVDAPVQYDAREFVLHLFARVCEEALGPERTREARTLGRPGDPLFARPGLPGPWALIGPALMALGFLILLGAGPKGPFQHISPTTWGVISLVAGYLITAAAAVVGSRPLAAALRRLGRGGRRGAEAGEEPGYRATAALRLREIRFQQSFSSGWSGSLKVPLGLEGGLSASSELAEKQLSFPDIVALLRDFLGQVASERQVRIGIDELDKMGAEDARLFLNEIKVIFRVPRCFFFVSVSEDAMSLFERRGLPFRDIFDSSFDEVAQLPSLGFETSRELLDRRIVGLPLSFACLLHCLSGGLPRDLIRAARRLLDCEVGTTLDEALGLLLADGLRAKAAATAIAGRPLGPEAGAGILGRWLGQLGRAQPGAEVLLAICRDFEAEVSEPLSELPVEGDEPRRARREVEMLATQLLASIYLSATLVELFARFEEPYQVDLALAPAAGDECQLDRLARVGQAFALDLPGGWEALSRLRADLGLEALAYPRPLGAGSAA